ncbi:efflux ABC transporter, permease protein [Marvinbryantia formatexigens DSM 14469]|uniref:Efflux ABC transporter, permease protein n=1 Tax=Marvinbryantia formatexigens DSM 14469 TaxID=478749 RepID=C6LCH1_9FIRM|nr:ABC transporter permease [Marvinbryantia formatexigens]EET61635.1 efflux ABC transporter, permease protein [Marvinbryantia formatexigens DSM 14469]UWO24542.1 FtsX-like permease family protein [Marvinbryantia formatexigens DSM 14469]SDF12457.1 putative ABC transport system permease protein [Marvinbryantia formatexigens]
MRRGLFRTMAWTNIRNNRRFYVPFLLTIILTAAMFYNMCSVSRNPAFTEEAAIAMVLEFGVYIIGIFAVIFIFYTNSFLTKRRKRELGLYHILGLEKRHISSIMAWETLYLAFAGIAGGIVAGLLLDRLMFLIILKVFHYPVAIEYRIDSFAVRTTLLVFAAIFLLIMLYNIHSIRKASAIELLKSGNTGEREPKTRWLIAVIGLVCMVSGYYIAITTDNILDALTKLFVAVLLVMAGTYCLFLAGSVALLKMLKKRKSYYYRTNHFVAVSGMIYRMKQNAVGLANICILSTGVLLVISTTVSLYAGMEEIVIAQHPTELAVTYSDSSPEQNQALEEMIEETASELGITLKNYAAYQSLSITFVQRENELLADSSVEDRSAVSYDDLAAVTMISAETYERMTGERLQLSGNEVAICHEKGTLADTFQMMGETYTVSEHLESFPVSNEMAQIVKGWFNIVVSSDEKLSEIDRLQKEVFSYPSSLKYEVQFDTEGGQETADTLYNTLLQKMEETEGMPLYLVGNRYEFRAQNYVMYGSILFLGCYLGALFLMATVLIIYYKQIIEGYEDRERYAIMRKVGMDRREIKQSIKSQILIMFFLPLGTALIHCLVAFPLMRQILQAFYMNNTPLFAGVTAVVAGIFSICYILVYRITARSYYHIVS